jgi:hypothetical protein
MNWKQFNFWNLWLPFIFFIVGIFMGLIYPCNSKPTKNYPIEVRCHWETGQVSHYPTMEADSVKGDSIWKDGIMIINKNIKNVEFK